jgi:hypothetical protein
LSNADRERTQRILRFFETNAGLHPYLAYEKSKPRFATPLCAPGFFAASHENALAVPKTPKQKKGNQTMKNRNITFATILLALGFLALSPVAQAVVPAPDGGYPGGNTAEGVRRR